jgi:cytochrome c-type biogenesis protein CcmH
VKRAALLALVLVLLGAAPAAAAAPRTTLPDVEDEVMCVECRTPLNVSTAAVAEQERRFIRRLIAEGKTKQQIKDALVAEFGPSVLAEPPRSGFDATAWAVPIGLGALALGLVVFVVRRWRRAPAAEPEPDAAAGDAAEQRRLDAELAAYDS